MQRSWNRWVPEVSSFPSPLASIDGLGVGVATEQSGLTVLRGLERHQASPGFERGVVPAFGLV